MKKVLFLIICLFVLSMPVFAESKLIVKDTSEKDAALRIMKYFIKNDVPISKISAYSFSLTPVNKNFQDEFWYGTVLSSSPKSNINVKVVQTGKDVLISLSGNTYYMSGKRQYVSYLTPLQEQAVLNRFGKLITGYYSYGFSYDYKNSYLLVTEVNKSNPFSSTLKKNMKITALDSIPVNRLSQNEISKKLIDLKTEKVLNLTIRENLNAPSKKIVLVATFVNPLENL